MNNLAYIVDHVFMPLKLPQQDEQGEDFSKDNALSTIILESAADYHDAALQVTDGKSPSSRWPAIISMLSSVATIHGSTDYVSYSIEDRFKKMQAGDVTALLVRKQNAGMVFRVFETSVVCEAFEASAPAATVMKCENKLVWTFPGPSTSIPKQIFDDATFRKELVSFIVSMNREILPGSAPHSKKAGSSSIEIRDTANPLYVSDLLMVILTAVGGEENEIVDPARSVEKRIADDVLWDDALAPWRRSALWLVIRVALQTTLEDLWEYKAFLLFAMSSIALAAAKESEFSSSTLDNMRKKLARRADKLHRLEEDVPIFVFDRVHAACKVISMELTRRWKVIQVADVPKHTIPWAPHTLDTEGDTRLKLEHSAPYIKTALTQQRTSSSSSFFQPQHSARLSSCTLDDIIAHHQFNSFVSSDDKYLGLADFEDLVRDELSSWTSRHLDDSQAPQALEVLLKDYYDAADKCYSGNAEQQSVMILTTLELWVALDRLVTARYPLLTDHPPEVPLSLLEPLLLRRAGELERVRALSAYLRKRWCIGSAPSIFSSPSSRSFAVRYYNESPELKTKTKEIGDEAERRREEKKGELIKLNNLYETRQQEYNSMVHSEDCWRRWYCGKCTLEWTMKGMTIQLHEWPLPSGEWDLKTVVFELYCPKEIASWREATYFLLHDRFSVCTSRSSSVNDHLHSYMSEHTSYDSSAYRITLASDTKSWLRTHYNAAHIPTTYQDVCKPHGLCWKLYDHSSSILITPGDVHEADVAKRCTLQLPQDPPYHKLQWAVSGTTHTENEVLSRQHECPRELSLHEFVVFGSLRAGGQVQWMNIARAFAARSLSFRSHAVHVLVSQTVQQYGSINSLDEAIWHRDVDYQSSEFHRVVLSAMSGLLDSYRDNWQEVVSVMTVVVVSTRLLASLPSSSPRTNEAHSLLLKGRDITYRWLQSMLQNLERTSEGLVESAKRNIREVAATCALTFDVKHPDLSIDNLAILVHCILILKDNREAQRDRSSSSTSRILLDRVERMLQALETRLRTAIALDASGLDLAVSRIWTAYQGDTDWKAMSAPNERWLMCQTPSSQYVQINILDGTLLVDGKPIGNLPSNITEHETYRRLFGQVVLRVVPAGEAGLDYQTVVNVSGNQAFFALRGGDLIIEAVPLGDQRRLRYIPHTKFYGDLPTPLVNQLVHWLDLQTGQIELRPLQALWSSSQRNWHLEFHNRTMFDAQSRRLLEPTSHSFCMIRQRLESIEDPSFFVMTAHQTVVDVRLPRLQLDFQTNVVSASHLQCSTYPNFVVDENPVVGSLVGLTTRLVLRTYPTDEVLPPRRRVLIPYGQANFAPSEGHVTVSINRASSRHPETSVLYADYAINEQLGMLVGNGTLRSHLFKVLLHALTSFPVADSLTGHSGVEEALNLLGSASCMSFQYLGDAELRLLEEICALTPRRMFYPKGMQVMQTVQWSILSPHAQLCAFERLVRRILSFNKELVDLFHDPNVIKPIILDVRAPEGLSRRAVARERLFPLVNLQRVEESAPLDSPYKSRASAYKQDVCHYSTALLVVSSDASRFPVRPSQKKLFGLFEAWGDVLLRSTPEPPFSYTPSWLSRSDFNCYWSDMYTWCRGRSYESTQDSRRFTLLFSLTAFAYERQEESLNVQLLPYFVSLLKLSRQIQFPNVPRHLSYDLNLGLEPSGSMIQSIVNQHSRSRSQTPSYNLSRKHMETSWDHDRRCADHYEENVALMRNALLLSFTSMWNPSIWPANISSPRGHDYDAYFDMHQIRIEVCELFQKCRANIELRTYANEVDSLLEGHATVSDSSPYQRLPRRSLSTIPPSSFHFVFAPLDMHCLLRTRSPPETPGPVGAAAIIPSMSTATLPVQRRQNGHALSPSIAALRRIFNRVADSPSRLHQIYAESVRESLDHLLKSERPNHGLAKLKDDLGPILLPFFYSCSVAHIDTLNAIADAVRPISSLDVIMDYGGLWPSSRTRTWLSEMTSTRWSEVRVCWRPSIGLVSSTLLDVQQAIRLMVLSGAPTRRAELTRELENCKLADLELVLEHPDWALIQIEGDFRARDIQVAVAREMFSPSAGRSISLQLNMGEGKSSVIAPMLAASLSDGSKLVRMVVLKPLAQQMFQLLCERLSGLPNRRIFYLPFSRQIKISGRQLQKIYDLNLSCIHVGGVLVSQPEHILSAKLLSVDKMLSSSSDDHAMMMDAVRLERLQHSHSRDILDGCDELLHPRYQLIYTMGKQQPLEGHPDRWLVIQDVLGVVFRCVRHLSTEADLSHGVEVSCRSAWSFPQVKFPIADEGSPIILDLLQRVSCDVLEGHLASLNTTHFSVDIKSAVRRFISSSISAEDDELLMMHVGQRDVLLQLRGLFAHGLLSYVLRERRWRIDYGLDPSRTLLAVPYRAKDVPSPRAEFGHPDIAIILTCLSYYYTGLSQDQVKTCLAHLFNDSNPAVLYETWIRDIMPEELGGLTEFAAINLSDEEQQARLVDLFCYCHAVIDFYLSNVVFPKAAKQFPRKLPTSAWDLAEKKMHVTVGFSGTKDNQFFLPLWIYQVDPVNQASTNAMVLTFLLQTENANYTCVSDGSGKTISGQSFVGMLAARHPDIRVLLDIGAQMLDLVNRDVAKRWLSNYRGTDVEAAVFFSAGDELMVVRRDGTQELLKSSPYRQRLSSCLIYLDDAHTRGTDLKFPIHWKAAVTLGRKVTKDRLVQGCMRMRQLGHGQSLHFFAQPDIDAMIKKQCKTDSVAVEEIIRWTMLETCADIEHHAPQWARQGLDFKQRRARLDALPEIPTPQDIERVRNAWLQPEARTLAEMYGDRSSSSEDKALAADPELSSRLIEMGISGLLGQTVDEEQEREVDEETEQERDVERPPPLPAAFHHLHDDVKTFLRTGMIKPSSLAFLSPYRMIRSLRHCSDHPTDVFHPRFLVTLDYAVTVQNTKLADPGSLEFLKDVQWILCAGGHTPTIVVISQFEANELVSILRDMSNSPVRLHIYSPRVTRSMQPFDDLAFYCVPPLPRSSNTRCFDPFIPQLNVYAGQLYPTTFEDFKVLSGFLGIVTSDDNLKCERDGFVKPEDRGDSMSICPFGVSPVAFVRELVATRRRGQDYSLTPVGKLLRGLRLSQEDIE